jgi:hypothetical protein
MFSDSWYSWYSSYSWNVNLSATQRTRSMTSPQPLVHTLLVKCMVTRSGMTIVDRTIGQTDGAFANHFWGKCKLVSTAARSTVLSNELGLAGAVPNDTIGLRLVEHSTAYGSHQSWERGDVCERDTMRSMIVLYGSLYMIDFIHFKVQFFALRS